MTGNHLKTEMQPKKPLQKSLIEIRRNRRPVSRKSRKLFGPGEPFVNLATNRGIPNRLFRKADLLTCFENSKKQTDDLNPLHSFENRDNRK